MGLFDGILGGGKKKKKGRIRKSKTQAIPKRKPKESAEGANEDLPPEEMEIDTSEVENTTAEPVESPESSGQDSGTESDNVSTVIISPQKRKPPKPGQLIPPPKMGNKPASSVSSRRKRTSIVKKRLGNLLISANVITEQQLEKALSIHEEKGGLLGQILVEIGACNAGNIGAALNKQRTITTVELDKVNFGSDALAMVSRETCERLRLIPFQKIGTLLCVAMSNVLDSNAKNEIRDNTQAKIKPFDASWQEISDAIEKYYTGDEAENIEESNEVTEITGEASSNESNAEDDDLIDLDNLEIELPDEESSEISEISEDGIITIDEVEEAAPADTLPAEDDTVDEVIADPEETVDEIIKISDDVTGDIDEPDAIDLVEDISIEEEQPEVVELAEIDEINTLDEIETPDAAEEIEVVDEIEEVEIIDDLELVEEIEEVEDIDSAPELVSEPEPDEHITEKNLCAIKVPEEYLTSLIEDGSISTQKRWLKNIIAETTIPAEVNFKGR
ncbi:MAG: GspE/PulE/PilB domain-containing protein [Planctomycetota bacterium]|jgi:hypothetical protein